MKTGGFGGANTLTGLNFEDKIDFTKLLLKVDGYSIEKILGKVGLGVYFQGKLVARCIATN